MKYHALSGIAKDKATAERDFVVSFENNELAHVGHVRRLKKSEFFSLGEAIA